MARSGLHGETKDARWPVRLAGVERMRITPTVEAMLLAWRPALLDKHEFIHDAVLLGNLTILLYDGRWNDLHRTLGHLLGLSGPSVPLAADLGGQGTAVPAGDNRPASSAVGDGAMREIAGARRKC